MGDYGARVRQCREALGWSQNALAMRVGGSWRQTTVARVEAGEQPLKLSDAVSLAKAFGMTLDEFVEGSNPPCRCAAVRQVLREALDALGDSPIPTANHDHPMPSILTLDEVSTLTRIPTATLRYWRSVGDEGPPSFKLGRRVMYRRDEVMAWIEANEAG